MDIGDLYQQAIRGDKTSEENLYRQLDASFRIIVLHRIWDKEVYQEIVQEALMAVFDKYRNVEIEKSFSAWAYSVLNHKILDYIKIKKIRSEKMDQFLKNEDQPVSLKPNPDLKARIKSCFAQIHEIHPRHARILNLKFQGYETAEICQKLDLSRNNFYTILSRARKMLEACIYGDSESDE